jgi:hypothetical protein
MNPGRAAVAYLFGILAVVLIVVAWLIGIVATSFRVSDCSGVGWAISCSTSNSDLIRFVVWAVLITAVAASVTFWTIRGLGRWASKSTEGPTPTIAAGVIVGVFAVAAAVIVAIYVANEWGGG